MKMDSGQEKNNISVKKVENAKEDCISASTDFEVDVDLRPYITFQERLCKILHSHKFQVIIISLVIFDCLLVISELMIDLEIVPLGDEHHIAPHVLHYMSIFILSLFIIEISAKIYAFRKEFFLHKLEVFDAIVVVLSFSLDIAFRNSSGAINGSGLIIILRLWRVARILNGIVLSVKTQAEHKLSKEIQLREAVEQELAKCRNYCAALEQEVESLRSVLKMNNIKELPPTVINKPVLQHNTVNVVAEVNNATVHYSNIM
ncbi:voltage-gated hydrogen channel 1-like [Centruroides sculpturatus]|uniref:voltage-gated hydrogen channel 1-like n=1 Tax=Centruroides sculpturatus TaxID=218467 RepID=UPI000C6D4992|nr:voltage-gated hydrogen channel 1-like [Centruroides sculpturatus]XP_023219448.1 voltage-gated hydrogen channel 1-like [Centruroides sculpturatus]